MPFCPRCRQEFLPQVALCTECHVPLVSAPRAPEAEPEASWSETVTVLTGPSEISLLPAKSLLEENGILAIVENEALSTVYGGLMDLSLTRGGPTLRVAREHSKRAGEILCENNIRCDVPPDAVERVVTRVFAPAIAGGEGHEPNRIMGLLGHQTKDFRRVVFSRVAHLAGGPEYLLSLLVSAVRDSLGGDEERNDLAASIASDHGGAAAAKLAEALLESSDARARERLASALGHFRFPVAVHALVRLLEDSDGAVRDEALEALYFLSEGETFGYEPAAPDADRAAPLAKWRAWAESLGPSAEGVRRA